MVTVVLPLSGCTPKRKTFRPRCRIFTDRKSATLFCSPSTDFQFPLNQHKMINHSDAVVEVLASGALGGGEFVAIELAEALARRRRAASVWVPETGMALKESQSRGLDAKVVPYTDAIRKQRLRSLLALIRFWNAAKSAEGAVFHVHSPVVYGGLSRVLSKRRRCVAHVQIDGSIESFRWCFQRPPNLVITCAQYLAEKVRRSIPNELCSKTRIEAVSNAVDTERFSPGCQKKARQQLNVDPEVIVLLMLANLAPHKGQETALRCTRILASQGRNVQCWFAGVEREGTEYTRHLRQLAGELEIAELVKFLGFRRDSEDLLRACDFLLLPSTNEGLPLTILEAQSAKRLVLAAPTAGIPEVIQHHSTGFLFNQGEPESYALQIGELVDNPRLYDEVASRAYQQIQQNHTWSVYQDRILQLYDSV